MVPRRVTFSKVNQRVEGLNQRLRGITLSLHTNSSLSGEQMGVSNHDYRLS